MRQTLLEKTPTTLVFGMSGKRLPPPIIFWLKGISSGLISIGVFGIIVALITQPSSGWRLNCWRETTDAVMCEHHQSFPFSQIDQVKLIGPVTGVRIDHEEQTVQIRDSDDYTYDEHTYTARLLTFSTSTQKTVRLPKNPTSPEPIAAQLQAFLEGTEAEIDFQENYIPPEDRLTFSWKSLKKHRWIALSVSTLALLTFLQLVKDK